MNHWMPSGANGLLEFLQANYVTGSTVIAVAGKIGHRQVLKSVSRFAGRIPSGKRPVFSPANPGQTAPRVCLFSRKTEQTQIALGIRTCSRHDSRRYALRLLNAILGENMSSRLFQIIREDRGLAYSIYSTPSFFTTPATWSSPPDSTPTISKRRFDSSCANCAG